MVPLEAKLSVQYRPSATSLKTFGIASGGFSGHLFGQSYSCTRSHPPTAKLANSPVTRTYSPGAWWCRHVGEQQGKPASRWRQGQPGRFVPSQSSGTWHQLTGTTARAGVSRQDNHHHLHHRTSWGKRYCARSTNLWRARSTTGIWHFGGIQT